jgi:hypothetical protein
MAAVFGILLVLSIPSMIFFYHGSTDNNIKDFKTAVSALSIGNIEAAKPACSIGPFNMTEAVPIDDQKTVIDREVKLVLSCPIGILNKLEDVGQVPIS